MLILKRRLDEAIYIGDTIRIIVMEIGYNWVKLSIEAPDDVKILREELLGTEPLPTGPYGSRGG